MELNKEMCSMNDKDVFITISAPTPVTVGRIKDLLGTAIEFINPKWCKSIDRPRTISKKEIKNEQDIPFIRGGFLIVVVIDNRFPDLPTNNETSFMLDINAIKAGLKIMAKKYPSHFNDFVSGNEDDETADVFLQCCLFGKWSADASTITNGLYKKK